MFVYVVSIITIFLYLWLSVLAFRRWGSGKAMRRFGFLLFATAAWLSIGFFQTYLPEVENLDTPRLYNFLGQSDFALASIISFLLASFAIHFPIGNKNFGARKELFLFVPPFILSILSYFNYFFSEGRLDREPEQYYPTYWLYISVLIIYFILIGLAVLIKKYLAMSGIQKLQLKYIVVSYGTSICFLLFLSIANAIDNMDIITDFWISNAALIFVTVSAYAVLKYRLLGIRFILRKSFISFLTLAILAGFYLFFFLSLQAMSDEKNLNSASLTIATIFVIVFSLPFLYPRILRLVHRIAQPSEEISRERIRARVRNIAKTMDYQVLFRSLLENVKEKIAIASIRGLTLEADNGYHDQFPEKKNGKTYFKRDHDLIEYFRKVDRVIVRQEFPFLLERVSKEAKKQFAEMGKILDNLGAEVAVLIGSKEVAPVVALLPAKRDRSAFTKEEIEFLRSLAEDMSQAFENFFLYRHALRRAGVEV